MNGNRRNYKERWKNNVKEGADGNRKEAKEFDFQALRESFIFLFH
jgi:hypothetical protein